MHTATQLMLQSGDDLLGLSMKLVKLLRKNSIPMLHIFMVLVGKTKEYQE